MKNKDLKRRIIDISYSHKLSHIGSNISAVDTIEHIYHVRKENEPFVLSNGHAGLALYVVLEKYLGHNAEELFEKHGVHPNRDLEHGIYVSSGSLGQGLPIACGMALADGSRDVYCTISDGECAEGSIWEALRVAREQHLDNLRVYCVVNGYSGYKRTDIDKLYEMIKATGFPVEMHSYLKYELPFLEDISAHYYVMSEDDYKVAMKMLE